MIYVFAPSGRVLERTQCPWIGRRTAPSATPISAHSMSRAAADICSEFGIPTDMGGYYTHGDEAP